MSELIGKEQAHIVDAFTVALLADVVAEKRSCDDATTILSTIMSTASSSMVSEYERLISTYCEM